VRGNGSSAFLVPTLSQLRERMGHLAIDTGKFEPSLTLAFRAGRLFGMRVEEIFSDEG
jgi:DNA-binding XRE family transcriptional regulator